MLFSLYAKAYTFYNQQCNYFKKSYMRLPFMMSYAWRGSLQLISNGSPMALGSTEPAVEANDTIPGANQTMKLKISRNDMVWETQLF